MKVDKYRRGQVWWYNADNLYIGNVQGGVRPVIIISNNKNNRYSNNLTVIPCTSADKKYLPTHVKFELEATTTALCEQITTIPAEKLTGYIGMCDNELLDELDSAVQIGLGLKSITRNPKFRDNIPTDTEYESNLEPTIPNEIDTKQKGRGRPIKYTQEYKLKFINDYDNYGIDYMETNYNLAKKDIQAKVKKFKSEL